MTYETAIAALEAARHIGKLENVRQIVEAYERNAGSSNHWESSQLLRHACDVINSHDFGDPKGQTELIRTYAYRALQRSSYVGLEQELRLLAHLQYDYEDGNESWPEKRLLRSRKWLRALQLLVEATREAAKDSLPRLKAEPSAPELPSGVAPGHVTEVTTRNIYRSTIDRNREDAEGFAFRWKMKQLRRAYEPLALKYVSSAYAREPYDLVELKELLNAFLPGDQEAFRELALRLPVPESCSRTDEAVLQQRKNSARLKKRRRNRAEPVSTSPPASQ
jgi:hypothetical protein